MHTTFPRIGRALALASTCTVLFSALAADSLQRMGYQNVLSLAGGWSAWVDAGGPVEGAR